MASFKEHNASRPLSQSRPISGTMAMSMPSKNLGHRHHAHSVSLGSLNNTHRVTRRKSMGSNNLMAAVQNMDDASLEALVSGEGKAPSPEDITSPVQLLKTENPSPDGQKPSEVASNAKGRNRRASEGSHLAKTEKKASNELKCDKCGKGYKHSSCLTKHLWEHTPEWGYTSKLLISKHQQVQLLEAASVLVNMNLDASVEFPKATESDESSASPAASGSSEIPDEDLSSVETTPPPLCEQSGDMRNVQNHSSASSVYSRSYQSVPGTSIAASSVPSSSYGSSFHYGFGRRPSTSGTTASGLPLEDEAGLAAAVKLVSFGTPRTVAQQMDDVPPVPPLPARYASHAATRSTGGLDFPFHQELLPPPLSHRISDERDVKMAHGSVDPVEDADLDMSRRSVSRAHSDEHEEGFFGRMEE